MLSEAVFTECIFCYYLKGEKQETNVYACVFDMITAI